MDNEDLIWMLRQDPANVVQVKAASAIESLQAEVKHWKSNHADIVQRKALLEQRPDLPVDRIPAMREMERLQAKVAELEKELAVADPPRLSLPACQRQAS